MAPPLDPIASLRAALRGHYEIEREIGQGAFATVYLARDLKHERKVALKILHADPTSETGELRFIREIRLLARLQHPNILPLHDSGHVEALLYYVMPYVSGDTLRDRIDRERQLAPDVSCNIARDVADALAYAHGQGIIHRDIKPENILLSAGHPVLADFGIARAIGLAGVRQLTRTGMGSPGTPAYMSPEQLMGDKELDGRSDTYSLGCVLYEMLTGKPPFAGKEGFVRRFTEPPPKVSSVRKDLPEWMDEVVSTALARSPNDRYQAAQDLATALNGPLPLAAAERTIAPFAPASIAPSQGPYEDDEITGEFISQRGWIDRLRPHRTPLVAAVVFLLAAATIIVTVRPAGFRSVFRMNPALDSSRFVILPFASLNPADARGGVRVSDRLYDAFTAWEGAPIVPDTRVAQAIREFSGPLTETQALGLARTLGAGKLIWGRTSGSSAPASVSVHLYDAASGDSKDSFVFLDSAADGRLYAPAVLRLLGARARPRSAEGGNTLTHSYAAWSAYGRGHIALSAWDLRAAEREFRDAVGKDDGYSPAWLWLAQVLAWENSYRKGEWEEAALRATSDRNRLSIRDRTIASGLAAMRSQDFPLACTYYRALTKADSLEFVGWFGLGECQALDSLVIPSRDSPSRWRFRSSFHSAALAYIRALRNDPGAHMIFPFERLKALLPTVSGQIRIGRTLIPQRSLFLAYPGLLADSLMFIPYPASVFSNLPAAETSTKQAAALAYDARLLREFAFDWTRDSPQNPDASEALADVLETSGELSGESNDRPSALSSLHRARDLATAPGDRLRLATREVWVRVKDSQFAAARALADSILTWESAQAAENAPMTVGLAALTGRLTQTAILARSSGDWRPASPVDLPSTIVPAAATFFSYSALGVCTNAAANVERDLDEKIDTYVADAEQKTVRDGIKARPFSLMAPCTSAKSALRIANPNNRLWRMQQAYARQNRKEFNSLLDSAIAESRIMRPGDLSFDYSYQLAWLRAAAGDTAGAARQLELSLNALPSASSNSLKQIAGAASMVRSMMLCAQLASHTGNVKTAHRWAQAVVTLWGGADPPLQAHVQEMRSILAARN
jgi:tetratricopeptide (TPR) repeat protein